MNKVVIVLEIITLKIVSLCSCNFFYFVARSVCVKGEVMHECHGLKELVLSYHVGCGDQMQVIRIVTLFFH